jgi:hypothetical protein
MQGLFFRTPQDQQQIARFNTNAKTMPSQLDRRAMPLPTGVNPGLGFDMDDDRRQSNSDDSTLEIETPTTANGPKGAYLDYGENVVVIPETIKEPSNTQPLSAAFQNSSADTSPASRHSGNEQDDDDGQSFLYACTYGC